MDFDGTKHLYFSQWLNDKDFFLAVMMPEELFVRSLYEAMRDYLFLSVVVSLIIMALIVLLSLRMTAFTHDLQRGFRNLERAILPLSFRPTVTRI